MLSVRPLLSVLVLHLTPTTEHKSYNENLHNGNRSLQLFRSIRERMGGVLNDSFYLISVNYNAVIARGATTHDHKRHIRSRFHLACPGPI